MNRRTFLCGLIYAVAGRPLAPEAQPTGKIYRIGYLAAGWGSGTAYLRPLEAFRQGLRELGWVEGQNVLIEYRFAEGRLDRLPGLAEELVRLKVDVIAARRRLQPWRPRTPRGRSRSSE
jgi:putative ABC transport system substrate-binding protein